MILVSLLTALLAGFMHALEPDHMAAVTTFVSRRPGPREAAGFGIRWGLGHSGAILAVGMVLVALHVRLPAGVTQWLEFGVGMLLLGLGLWLLWTVLHERAHALAGDARGHTHVGEHAHPHGHSHAGSLWVGVAHGLAGTAPLVALLPVTLIASPWLAAGYLLLFGVGTTLSMGIYAFVAGQVFQQAGARLPRLAGMLRAGTALGSAALGVVWMIGAAAG
ncbi:MAG TPA: sulfite exporter TauE/SafE family protein [Longimicrobiaceae bacterium]|jgi:ABC-type nickel/cobalt efflux system permease component RcnA|nr:sulfite exporter TauE/SafE family protein [Longimicrobiaceae bacterium]